MLLPLSQSIHMNSGATGILLFILGTLLGFINTAAGGGSFISIPVLILAGLDPITANGTNRFSIVVQNAVAICTFRTQHRHPVKQDLVVASWLVLPALLGYFAAASINALAFRALLAICMFVSGVLLLLPKRSHQNRTYTSQLGKNWTFVCLIGMAIYGGFIQAGAGVLLMALLYRMFKYDLVELNFHKAVIIVVYTVPVLGLFLAYNQIHWLYATYLSVGTGIGAALSAKVMLKTGERFVRVIVAIATFGLVGALFLS